MVVPGAIALAAAAFDLSAAAHARSSAEQAIRQVISAFTQSWDRGDAAGIASAYESRGDFVSPDGLHAVGRAAIEAFYEAAFARGYAHSRGEFTVRGIRFIRPDFAIVDGVWEITNAHDPNGRVRVPERGLAVALLRKHGAGWQIVALREQASATELREM